MGTIHIYGIIHEYDYYSSDINKLMLSENSIKLVEVDPSSSPTVVGRVVSNNRRPLGVNVSS